MGLDICGGHPVSSFCGMWDMRAEQTRGKAEGDPGRRWWDIHPLHRIFPTKAWRRQLPLGKRRSQTTSFTTG